LNAASNVRSLTSFDKSPTNSRNHSGYQLLRDQEKRFDRWQVRRENNRTIRSEAPSAHMMPAQMDKYKVHRSRAQATLGPNDDLTY
jgi:hypothetical protein